jgi:small-conductance mechanosensitive channel
MLNKWLSYLIAPQVIHTLIAIAVIFLVMLALYLLFRRRFENNKQRSKFRSQLTYIGTCFFLIAATQIWIEGLSHIFTALGLVAAGLVVTNKETVMNIAGFLILNWRGIFTEGDFIQVQNYTGYVESIRPLYFKIYETTSLDQQVATGKNIKIPNGLILTNAVSTFSPESNLFLNSLHFNIEEATDFNKVLQITEEIIQTEITTLYEKDALFTNPFLRKRNKNLNSLIQLKPSAYIKCSTDKAKTATVYIQYYSRPKDSNLIESVFWTKLKEKLTAESISFLDK